MNNVITVDECEKYCLHSGSWWTFFCHLPPRLTHSMFCCFVARLYLWPHSWFLITLFTTLLLSHSRLTHLFGTFFNIIGAISKFVAYYNACQHCPGRKWRKGGRNELFTHMSDLSYNILLFQHEDLSYNLLFFQNVQGICIQWMEDRSKKYMYILYTLPLCEEQVKMGEKYQEKFIKITLPWT